MVKITHLVTAATVSSLLFLQTTQSFSRNNVVDTNDDRETLSIHANDSFTVRDQSGRNTKVDALPAAPRVTNKREDDGTTKASTRTNFLRQTRSTSPSTTSSTRNMTRHAIIVPYRDRKLHLSVFLQHMSTYLRFLKERGAEFDIWIVEQDDKEPFNRGWLANVGITEAIKHSPDLQCIVMHDVDLVPDMKLGSLGYIVPYDNCTFPIRLGNELENWNWGAPYRESFGGIVGASRDHWLQMNGLSNLFSGWGKEDDELYQRVRQNKFLVGKRLMDKSIKKRFVVVPPHSHGVFRVIDETNLSHPVNRKPTTGSKRFAKERMGRMKKNSLDWKRDGLSTLSYLLEPKRQNASEVLPGFASYHHIYARWDLSKGPLEEQRERFIIPNK